MEEKLDCKLFLKNSIDCNVCIILCSMPDKAGAEIIAKRLLADKLAACVTLLPNGVSIYYWKDKLEEQSEIQLFIKSNITLKEKIFKYIKSNHPYQIPELLVIPVISGSHDYLSWLNNSLH